MRRTLCQRDARADRGVASGVSPMVGSPKRSIAPRSRQARHCISKLATEPAELTVATAAVVMMAPNALVPRNFV